MMCKYQDGIIDHNILIKDEVSEKVIFIVSQAQACNVMADDIDNPTEDEYELLGQVACVMLAFNIWAADELPHVCKDCIDKLAEDICSKFRRKHKKCLLKKLRNRNPVRLGYIVHTAATFVAISLFEVMAEWDEDILAAAEKIERTGVNGDAATSNVGGGADAACH
jgi:hypothetical protein